jgi:hypothetical protein
MENLIFQCTVSDDLSELADSIHDYQITHSGVADLLITEVIGNKILKTLTGCSFATQSDLNCYPLGQVDTVLFDADGNVVP